MQRSTSRTLPLALLAGGLLAATDGAAVAQSLLVVDKVASQGDFQSIGAAIAAAGEGDAILVRAGSFAENLAIDGKSLRITAEEGALVFITTPYLDSDPVVRVHGLQAGQSVVCLLYTSPSPRDGLLSRMPSSA